MAVLLSDRQTALWGIEKVSAEVAFANDAGCDTPRPPRSPYGSGRREVAVDRRPSRSGTYRRGAVSPRRRAHVPRLKPGLAAGLPVGETPRTRLLQPVTQDTP